MLLIDLVFLYAFDVVVDKDTAELAEVIVGLTNALASP